MCKKFTRGTQETLKVLIQKAQKLQGQKAQKLQAQVRVARDTQKAPKALKKGKVQAASVQKAPKAQTADTRYSYVDCLCDKAPTPMEVNGSTLYQLMMVGCMVLFVFTANGVGHSGVSFLAQSR